MVKSATTIMTSRRVKPAIRRRRAGMETIDAPTREVVKAVALNVVSGSIVKRDAEKLTTGGGERH
jgi:hypothetical protein